MSATRRAVMAGLVLLALLGAMTPTAGAGEKVKVTYWTWLSTQPLVEEFNKTHPLIQVELVNMGAYDLQNKLLVALASGTGAPDVATLIARNFSLFSTSGKLVDLTEAAKDIRSDYAPNLIASVSHASRMYGLPADVSPAVLWYRRDVLKQHNIPLPLATWDDFVKAGETLKKSNIYIMPLFNPPGAWGANALTMYLHSRGGTIYTEAGKLVRDNTELEFTLHWVNTLHRNQLAEGITFFTPEFWGAFKAGRYAAWPMNMAEGANLKKFLPEQSGQWGVMPFPKWNDRTEQTTGIWGGNILSVPLQSKVREAATTFVKWVAGSVEGQLWASRTWNAVPSYGPALKNAYYAQGDPYFGNDNPFKMINPIKPFYHFDWAVTERIIGKHLDLMFAGRETPQAARAGIEKDIADETNR